MLYRFPAALVLLVAVFGAAWGDEPKIVGPEKLAPYKIARYTAVNVGPTDGVLWRVTPTDAKAKKSDVDIGLAGKRNGRELEFTAPPGGYDVTLVIVKQPGGAGGALEINEVNHTLTIGTAPVPVPPKPPEPAPKPKPVPPKPTPEIDAELSAKYKTALDADAKAIFPMGGTKENAVKLADVYLVAAGKLTSSNEADWPKTVGALFEAVGNVSVSQRIPRLPYLSAVRDVSSTVLGSHDSTAELDAAKRADLAARYKRAGLALRDAAK